MIDYNDTKLKVLGRLQFRQKDHAYILDGMRIPSVTQVIDPLLPYNSVPRDVREEALQRGDVVHKLTEMWDRGEEIQAAKDAEKTGLEQYLGAWVSFKQEMSVNVVELEQRLYHRKYRYAGTLDRLATFGDDPGQLVLLEIKTGVLMPEHRLQTAAYQAAVNDGRTCNKIRGRYVIQLRPDGRFCIEEHKDRADFDVFLAALTIGNWRLRNGN